MKNKYIFLVITIVSLGSFYAKQTMGSTEAPQLNQLEKTQEWRKSYELERTSPAEAAPQVLAPLPLEQSPDSVVFTPRGAEKHFTFNEGDVGYNSGRASGCLGSKYWV